MHIQSSLQPLIFWLCCLLIFKAFGWATQLSELGVIEMLKVWKWPIVHRSKFWPIYVYVYKLACLACLTTYNYYDYYYSFISIFFRLCLSFSSFFPSFSSSSFFPSLLISFLKAVYMASLKVYNIYMYVFYISFVMHCMYNFTWYLFM